MIKSLSAHAYGGSQDDELFVCLTFVLSLPFVFRNRDRPHCGSSDKLAIQKFS
jgi:hypothetical protein